MHKGGCVMDYESAYKTLFNAMTDALMSLERERMMSPDIEQAKQLLRRAQQKTEDMFIDS